MQITLKDRETITGVLTIYTAPVDLASMSMFTFNVTVHSAGGTSPTLTLAWETSDNLEDWLQLTGSTSQDAIGTSIDSHEAKTSKYGRYVRASIAVTGTSPIYNYSL